MNQTGGGRGPQVAAQLVATAATLAVGVTAALAPHGHGGAAVAHAVTAASAPVVAEWKLDEAAGSIAHDSAGGHDADLDHVKVGVAAQGPATTSFGFTRASRVTAATGGVVPLAATAWFRTPHSAGGVDEPLLSTPTFRVAIVNRQVRFTSCLVGRACTSVAAGTQVTDGAWHLVAVSLLPRVAAVSVDDGPPAIGPGPGLGAPRPSGVTIGGGFVGNIDRVILYGAPLSSAQVAGEWATGACPQSYAAAAVGTTSVAPPVALPLHTDGRYVVDAHGTRLKLAGVNWYGAEEYDAVPAGLQCESADAIASRIAASGFNVVRLPWATDTWLGSDPAVPPVSVAADPSLRGLPAREVFDQVIAALARHHLLVILDNHTTRPGWCCHGTDGNALWWEGYAPHHPPDWQHMTSAARHALVARGTADWLTAWQRIAWRYGPTGLHPTPQVVGADLRNEPRGDSLLGLSPRWPATPTAPAVDWATAATAAGNRVLAANPRLLVLVEGLFYSTDLTGAAGRPIVLHHPGHLVYSVHDYPWTQVAHSPGALASRLGTLWGWLVTQNQPWTTPVVVGEFGSCHPDDSSCSGHDRRWLRWFASYLQAGDLDWVYWSVNGTPARADSSTGYCWQTPRLPGCIDNYGVSDPTWSRDASSTLSALLRRLAPATQR